MEIRKYWLGKKFSEEHKKNIGLGLNGHRLSKETKYKISEKLKGKPKSKKHKIKLSLSHLGKKQSKEIIRKRIQSRSWYKHSKETKKKIAQKYNPYRFKKGHVPWNKGLYGKEYLKHYKDGVHPKRGKKISKETLEKMLIGLRRRPTFLEKEFERIIKKYDLSYKYVGDGSFNIGYKNPDFIEINGKKICIEVANKVPFQHPKNYEENRVKHFAKYGWECLVFFSNRNGKKFLDSEKVILQKINEVEKIWRQLH